MKKVGVAAVALAAALALGSLAGLWTWRRRKTDVAEVSLPQMLEMLEEPGLVERGDGTAPR